MLIGNGVSARLVEVEAYRADDDPGSHAFRGRTPRNASMFGAPGTLYVYFSYGNSLVHERGVRTGGARPRGAAARAPRRSTGLDVMRERRVKAKRDRDLTAGPGRLGQAFAADRSLDGTSLLRGPLRIVDDGTPPPPRPGVSPRIGLAPGKGEKLPYRFYVPGDENISRPPRT